MSRISKISIGFACGIGTALCYFFITSNQPIQSAITESNSPTDLQVRSEPSLQKSEQTVGSTVPTASGITLNAKPLTNAVLPDRDMMRTITTLTSDINVTEMDSATLRAVLLQQGIKTVQSTQGSPKTGQRIEVQGSAKERGLSGVTATFDLKTDGKESFSRLRFTMPPGEKNFAQLTQSLISEVPHTVLGIKTSPTSQRWDLNDNWILWARSYENDDPNADNKNEVQVTLEYKVE